MNSYISKFLCRILLMTALFSTTNVFGAFISSTVQWGDESISLDEPIPQLRTITFSSSQPVKWTLYRKVTSKSNNLQQWYAVGSCATLETSWQTPSPEIMSYLMPDFEAYYMNQGDLRLTPFKISAEANGVKDEIEFLWNVYPTTPEMSIPAWTFDLDTELRKCENSEMELEIQCIGQQQYAIGVTPRQQYFSFPEDSSNIKLNYTRYVTDAEIYKTSVIGQWGWILHVVAINHFGSTPGNYLLTNDYISNPEQKSIIDRWNPNPSVSINQIDGSPSGLYVLSQRSLLLSDDIQQACIFDSNGLRHCQWNEGGCYNLSGLPSGFYILTLTDSFSQFHSYKLSLR